MSIQLLLFFGGYWGGAVAFQLLLYNSLFLLGLVNLALILGLGNFVTLLMGPTIFNLYPYSQIAVGMRVRSYENMSFSELALFLIINIVWMTIGISLSRIMMLKKYHF